MQRLPSVLLILIFSLVCSGCRQEQPQGIVSQAASPGSNVIAFSVANGSDCFIYKFDFADRKTTRVTSRKTGCEFDPSFSHDGKMIVYSLAKKEGQNSRLMTMNSDGTNDRELLSEAGNNSHPVFAKDDKRVFFLRSQFFGNYDGITRPNMHDIDIFYVSPGDPRASELTEQHYYSVRSLSLSPDGKRLLVSSTRYPIGDLFETYDVDKPQAPHEVYQPHVPGEPSIGPAFGDASYLPDGLTILFLAATNRNGGNYDYNAFTMSAVTGSEIQQITSRTGMAGELQPLPDGNHCILSDGGSIVLIDLKSHTTTHLPLREDMP